MNDAFPPICRTFKGDADFEMPQANVVVYEPAASLEIVGPEAADVSDAFTLKLSYLQSLALTVGTGSIATVLSSALILQTARLYSPPGFYVLSYRNTDSRLLPLSNTWSPRFVTTPASFNENSRWIAPSFERRSGAPGFGFGWPPGSSTAK